MFDGGNRTVRSTAMQDNFLVSNGGNKMLYLDTYHVYGFSLSKKPYAGLHFYIRQLVLKK